MQAESQKTQASTVRSLVAVAVFTALSAGGGLIKLPSPVGSVALDSFPGFFSAGFFSPLIGGIVGLLGHLASAATAGFPLGPTHIAVAILMFFWCAIFGIIIRKINKPIALIPASLLAIFLNGVVSPLLLGVVFTSLRPILWSWPFIGYLTFAAFVNIAVAAIVVAVVSKLDIPGI